MAALVNFYYYDVMYELFIQVVELVESFGYLGIFIMTVIESTFIPIPSEITLIPAGYLVQRGEMNLYGVFTVSVFGTLCGSLLNYTVAYHLGRKFLLKYGKYLFLNEKKLDSMENFFKNHGAISMFSGRLLPGIKHFISFPAGLGKMDLKIFTIYTILGGAIWVTILIALGYLIGKNEDLVQQYLKQINIGLIIFVIGLVAFYILKRKKN